MCGEPAMIAFSLLSTGARMAQQRQQAAAVNAAQRQRAEIARRDLIASYDRVQRNYFAERAEATRKQTENALKALAARERLKVGAGARGQALSSNSVEAAINSVSATELRANQALDAAVEETGLAAADALGDAGRRAELSALSNRGAAQPNFAAELAGLGRTVTPALSRALDQS